MTVVPGDWFEQGGKHWLQAFAEFWRDNDEYRAGRPWLLMICIKYTGSGPFAWFQRWLRTRPINACLESLEKIGIKEFDERFGIPGVVLPCLGSVPHEEIIRWVDHSEVEILSYGLNVAIVNQHVRDLPAHMSMCQLGMRLTKILKIAG
ncbi:hypothetical protein QUF61_15275 [Candidatus Venteria ishoeyi]|uniref:hypothetical protein n=1 Tax=Candidatus Venteria ishoeyi TaxID=1899563 RepID=UPI0025A61823|nr:hypothetical protein [Candidatus Venteria ishoeyi]MDM8547851.1 hypothetical protein [Candidatus Venteria ishoeyi]